MLCLGMGLCGSINFVMTCNNDTYKFNRHLLISISICMISYEVMPEFRERLARIAIVLLFSLLFYLDLYNPIEKDNLSFLKRNKSFILYTNTIEF